MRFMTFSIAGSFLVAVLTMAMWPQDARFGSPSKSVAQENDNPDAPAPKAKPTASDSTQRTSQTEAALNQVIDLDFNQTEFIDVKEELENKTGLNFILTDSACDDGLSEDEPITFKITNMPLGKSLDLMLTAKNATYVIDSGAVLFISLDEADDERWFRVKMFDCRELVKALPKSAPPVRLFRPRNHFGGSGIGGGVGGRKGGTQTGKSNTKNQPAKKPPSESQLLDRKLQQIMKMLEQEATRRQPQPSVEYTLETLVRSMAGSETWGDGNGYGSASLKVVNGILIVRNSETCLLYTSPSPRD